MHPIALSTEQLELITAAAQNIPWSWRSRFLQAIGDELTDCDLVTNTAVVAAIRRVRPRFQSAPPDTAA